MELIKRRDEIKKNIETLNTYLNRRSKDEYAFAAKLIKKGRCFVAVESENGYRFYPSKFVGYVSNAMNCYIPSKLDGRDTNKAITDALKQNLQQNAKLEQAYIHYCDKLGVKPERHKKSFWLWMQ